MTNGQARSAIVTGSTSGIGLGIARALAAQKCNLVLNGFGDAAEIENIRTGLEKEFGIRAWYHAADLSKAEQCADLITQAERSLGQIDILVNNAGIQHVSPIETFPLERWEAIIALNLSSVFYTTRAVLSGMRMRGWGRIINIASVHGLVASVNKSAYVAAKHGVLGLTKSTALETAGTGITCNAICPGWVLTPLVKKQIDARAQERKISTSQAQHEILIEKQPSDQFATIEQVGSLTAFLCSPGADSITGIPVPIDGGWTAQ